MVNDWHKGQPLILIGESHFLYTSSYLFIPQFSILMNIVKKCKAVLNLFSNQLQIVDSNDHRISYRSLHWSFQPPDNLDIFAVSFGFEQVRGTKLYTLLKVIFDF